MQTFYDLDTPTLLVDLDRLERNIEDMASLVASGKKTLRPHTKTHKTPEVARMQAGAGATGLTVAKLGEAEVMADAGFDDLFIANQLVGPPKVERLLALAERVQVRVGLDGVEAAEPIHAAARQRGIQIPVLIEVDTGLGRAGVRSLSEAVELAQKLMEWKGLSLLGLFTHEGHLYRGKDGIDREGAAKVADQMRELRAAFASKGLPNGVISVGSTPGAPLLCQEEGLTEMRPGVYVYLDRMQVHLGAERGRCALTVLATVISVRSDGKIILDAGTKSLASDCPFPDKTFGESLEFPELRFAGASEEHGHLQAEGSSPLRVGEKVRIIPNHACTCVNMHDRITAVRGERVEAVWEIAGRGKIK